jgi:hypothetical protein
LSNTWINLTYTTGHFVLKQLAVNVRYAEILALPLSVPFWPDSSGSPPSPKAAFGNARLFARTAAYGFRCELTLSAR